MEKDNREVQCRQNPLASDVETLRVGVCRRELVKEPIFDLFS